MVQSSESSEIHDFRGGWVAGQPAFNNFTSINVITDKAGLMNYSTFASNIYAFSTQCSITLDQTTGKITITVNSGYCLYISIFATWH